MASTRAQSRSVPGKRLRRDHYARRVDGPRANDCLRDHHASRPQRAHGDPLPHRPATQSRRRKRRRRGHSLGARCSRSSRSEDRSTSRALGRSVFLCGREELRLEPARTDEARRFAHGDPSVFRIRACRRSTRASNCSRARRRRDATVPCGRRRRPAISPIVISSIS